MEQLGLTPESLTGVEAALSREAKENQAAAWVAERFLAVMRDLDQRQVTDWELERSL